MTNRRMQDSDYFISEDDPIGLTGAFRPTKGPQSVEYDKGDQAIGLTGAFEPITIEEDERSWDENAKWKGFDWESYQSTHDEASEEPAPAADADAGAEGAQSPAPAADAAEGVQQGAQQGVQQGASVPVATATTAAASSSSSRGSGRGRHAAPDAELSPRMKQSRKTRRVLIVVIILLLIAGGVLGFIMYRTYSSSQEEAAHQKQEQVEAPKESLASQPADDATDAPAKLTDVPELASLLGMTSDEAVNKLGHGAMVTANRPVNEEGNPIKTSLNVALNEEPWDSKTGVPTVYLGLDQDGKIIQVGYSASASALGFGSLSFSDAVNSEHVIEKTLGRIGVNVPEGSAVLPDDKSEYSTYGSDGSTVTRERCSFEGDIDVNGTPCVWSAVLSYDYTTQVVTGDLSDTVRVIYVYLTKK